MKMDNSTNFEYKGIWWFPSKPSKKLPGILKYSPLDGIELSIEEYDINLKELINSFNKKAYSRYPVLEKIYGFIFDFHDLRTKY